MKDKPGMFSSWRKLIFTFFISFAVFAAIRYLVSLPLDIPKFGGESWRLVGPFLINVIYLLLFLALVVGLIVLLLTLFIDKKEISKKTQAVFLVVSIIVSLFLSGLLSRLFFPDALTNYNRRLNTLVVEGNISAKDVEEIKEFAHTLSSENPLKISYYQCKKAGEQPGQIDLGIKPSRLCRPGDIELTVGYNKYCGGLCGEYKSHLYLIRKVDGKWKLIEDLGEQAWVS